MKLFSQKHFFALFVVLIFSHKIYSQSRKIITFNDGWKFQKGKQENTASISFDDSKWQSVSVPHDWAIYGPFDKEIDMQNVAITQNGEEIPTEKTGRTGSLPHIGEAWYRIKFDISERDLSKNFTLLFEGAMSEPEVFLNEKKVSKKCIIVDVETTGKIHEEDNIIEIVGIEIIAGKMTGNTFHSYFPPRKEITKEAFNANKISNNFYKENCQSFYLEDKRIFQNFIDFCKDMTIICHNAEFDKRFINDELKFHNLKPIPKEQFLCSLKLTKAILSSNTMLKKPKKFKLWVVCEFFNIKVDFRQAHTAFGDANLTAKLIRKICEEIGSSVKPEVEINLYTLSVNNIINLNVQNEGEFKAPINKKSSEFLKKAELIDYFVNKNNILDSFLNRKKKRRPFSVDKKKKTIYKKAQSFLLILTREDNFDIEDYKNLKKKISDIIKPMTKIFFEWGEFFIFHLEFDYPKKFPLKKYNFGEKLSEVAVLTQSIKLSSG